MFGPRNGKQKDTAKTAFPQASLHLYRAADGTLLLFPTAWIYVLPKPVILSPPYVHDTAGRIILDMASQWFDPPKPDGPPEKKFWTAAPGCRSYRAFHRAHQLIGVKAEQKPDFLELSLHYMPRKSDGSYGLDKGDVEISCLLSQIPGETEKKFTHRIGSAVRQIFCLAEVADPLPSAFSSMKS